MATQFPPPRPPSTPAPPTPPPPRPSFQNTAADVAVGRRDWVDLDGLDVAPPPNRASNDYLIQWLKRRTYRASPLYLDDYSRARKSELYDQGAQWVMKAQGSGEAGNYAYQWKKLSYLEVDGQRLPLPVYNEGVLLRENESARLGRPEYKPRSKPNSQNPGIKERDGAKGCERALQSRLKDMWSNEEDKLYLHQPLYGGTWIKSHWDQTWLETVRVPAPSLACPRVPPTMPEPEPGDADNPLAPLAPPNMSAAPAPAAAPGQLGPAPQGLPPMVPTANPTMAAPGAAPMMPGQPGPTMPGMPGMMGGQPGMPGQPGQPPMGMGMPMPPMPPEPQCDFRAPESQFPLDAPRVCPMCEDHPPLEPYQPTMEEALTTDLGMDVPKGDWFMRVVFPYNMFPRDGGVGVDPNDLDEWVECYATPISDMEARYPEQIRDMSNGQLRVHPQNTASLMSENPTLGSPDLLEYAALHSSIYRTHVVVYEYNRKPWLEYNPDTHRYEKNRGRTIVGVTGQGGSGIICYDGVLMVESLNKPGEFVARTHMQFVPWELVDGGRRATVGQSLWDRLFDPQDGINERASQTRAVNQRGAIPFYLEMAGSNLEMLEADVAVPFRRIRAYIDPNARQLPLQLLNNDVINPGVYAEIDFNVAYMSKNIVEVEKGQVPPGVAAATAIAYLKTESGEKRRPRILRIRRALTRSWAHGARLMAALYVEPRPYTFEDEDGDEKQAFISGDILAQANPKVDIYPTPDYDVTDARRESIRDMVQLGILDPAATPQLSRKIVAAMDESLEFFIDDDLQEQQAQREWRDFMEKGRVPVVDPSLDDDLSHYQCHGRDCFSEWFRKKEDEADWDGALAVIGTEWDQIKEVVMSVIMQGAMMPMMGMPMPGAMPGPGGLGGPGMMPGAPAPGAPPGVPPVPGAPPAGGPVPGAPGVPPMAGGMGAPPDPMTGTPMTPPIDPMTGMPKKPAPKPSIQDMLATAWSFKLQQAQFPPTPALLDVVIPWRAHMEAHNLKVELKQRLDALKMAPSPAAPAKGSTPTTKVEAEAAGAPTVASTPPAPGAAY